MTAAPALDWTQCNLDRNRAAYDQARREFVDWNGFEPSTSAEYSSIFRRQGAIMRGEI